MSTFLFTLFWILLQPSATLWHSV